MSDDKIFMEDAINIEERNPDIEKLKGEFKSYSVQKQKSLAAKALEINIAFNIDTRQIAANLYKTKPLTQIGFVLYWTVLSIFCLMTILWIRVGAQLIFLEVNITQSLYIFKSLLLWLITAITLVNTMIFAPMVFVDKKFSTKAKIIFFGSAFVLNIIVMIGLPLIL